MFSHVLLLMARGVVAEVTGQINQQIEVMHQEILASMQSMSHEVANGEIWQGRGAQQFVDACQQELTSPTQEFMTGCQELAQQVQACVGLVEDADKQGAALAQNLSASFQAIYNGEG